MRDLIIKLQGKLIHVDDNYGDNNDIRIYETPVIEPSGYLNHIITEVGVDFFTVDTYLNGKRTPSTAHYAISAVKMIIAQ